MTATINKINPFRVPIGLSPRPTVNELATFLADKKIPTYKKFTKGQAIGALLYLTGVIYGVGAAFKKLDFLSIIIPTGILCGLGPLFNSTFKNYSFKFIQNQFKSNNRGDLPPNGSPTPPNDDPSSPPGLGARNPIPIINWREPLQEVEKHLKVAVGYLK